ncbi:hypothetical protein [Cellulomonas rhizosphaerae]|uniref:Transposase n=1 Tax=Cellulomonas rhizosphaerae TaxID=2293719 RepID=A0A413RHV4_9CELL|nr:hypothetical protein [Cellulomonas rhizosphaerae]RHA37751.1 hypothetical protein D1825_16040 [Cellulomonas rhizosphaerae]
MARPVVRIGTLDRLQAVLSSPSIYRLGAELTHEHRIGRCTTHPPYVMLQFAALARLARSGIRVEVVLANATTWAYARQTIASALAQADVDLPEPGRTPPTWEQWRWFRDHHLATEDGLGTLGRVYPQVAVELARSIGQLNPRGPGSLTHPDASRTVYGDGTIVRPIYQPPEAVRVVQPDGSTRARYPDPRTGRLEEWPSGRFDPNLAEHHGTRGPVQGHGYVAFHTRGRRAYERVVLAVDHIPEPGAEAPAAVRLLGNVARDARDGIQLVVYDGAFHGVHIDEVMRRHGYLVISKIPTGQDVPGALQAVRTQCGRLAKSYPLGLATHTLPTGSCSHAIATIGGRVVQLDLDERGDPVVIATPRRGPIKRTRRANGDYHFNLGYDIDCPYGDFTVWLSPGGTHGDYSRPENLRAIPDDDPDSLRLRGLRSDAESFHANLKRTLLTDRAMSLGWRRGLLDVYAFSLLNNALTEFRALQVASDSARRLPTIKWAK